MLKKYTRTFLCLFTLLVICALAVGGFFLSPVSAGPLDLPSYRDIPGVTSGEIAAIEELKASGRSFVYGSLLTTEIFTRQDGKNAGFTVTLCDLLSDLFGIPFVPEIYSWTPLISGLNNHTVDFTGELTPTPDRQGEFLMSAPITQRGLGVYFDRVTTDLETEADLDGLTIGFLAGTITEQAVRERYPDLNFQTAPPVRDMSEAAAKLLNGSLSAFIVDAVATLSFNDYRFVASTSPLPFVYTPVSVSTKNPGLEPIISVLSKYIAAGGNKTLDDMYTAGENEYAKHELSTMFTWREKNWLAQKIARGEKVRVALENANYPICFYDEKTGEFQGIVPDMLSRIEDFTGMEFEIVTDEGTGWSETLGMLASGDASMVSELLRSPERENSFIWAQEPYYTTNYALLSKVDYPDLKMYHVPNVIVGAIEGGAAVEEFSGWFPGNENIRLYPNENHAFAALESGEIDLFMSSELLLLAQTNYREKPGYKVNISIPAPVEAMFGFNKNEELLRSVIDKAQMFINTDDIARSWTGRVSDYSRQLAEERLKYLTVSAGVMCLLFTGTIVVFFMFLRKNKLIVKHAAVLKAFYDSSPDLIYTKDTAGVYTSCNRAFTAHFEDIVGKRSGDLFVDEKLVDVYVAMDNAIYSGESIAKAEVMIYFPDGCQGLFDITKFPIIENGEVTGLIAVCRDITKFRKAEQAAISASKSKSDFLARMSHEIRTPMNAIVGMTELTLREKNVEKIHEYALTTRQAGNNLLSIINDILDFSKIEQGKLKIIPEKYSLSSLINDVVSIIRMRAMESRIRFAVNIDSHLPNALFGDETRLRQIMLNLLVNAVKYTEKGFVSLAMTGEVSGDAASGSAVVNLSIEVKDSGKGIKSEDLEFIWGEYNQSDRANNKHIEGIGLGLSITRRLVEAMGGSVDVRSEYRRGSTFTVTVPQTVRRAGNLASVYNVGAKSIIVYERRAVYADSVVSSMKDLGVSCKLVTSLPNLLTELSGEKFAYTYLFISLSLYEQNKEAITRIGSNVKIILLTEFGEAITDSSMSILSMPTHCISIANILNGEYSRYSYNEKAVNTAHFTLPDAKILVVDDINTNLKVAEGLIAPYAAQIDLCKSGFAALEAIENKRYDLVFMDHKMPEMDGVEAVSHIREKGEEDAYYKDVPIIALTANAVSGMREMFLSSGFNDYLSKPIDTNKLNAILAKWIPKSKQQHASKVSVSAGAKPSPVDIEGIDAARGIRNSGGSLKLFLETLEVFREEGLEKMAELKKNFESKDWKNLGFYAHALKSALANVGAADLSDRALALELAASRDDARLITESTPSFISDLEDLLSRIPGA